MNLAVWYGASDKIAEKKPEEIMRDILHEDVEGNGDNSHVLLPERFRKRPPADFKHKIWLNGGAI